MPRTMPSGGESSVGQVREKMHAENNKDMDVEKDAGENNPTSSEGLLSAQENKDDSLDNDVDADGTDTRYNPVDKGYSWIVMIASFGIQFLLIGYIKSLGVLFVELQERFNSTSAETSIIVAVMEMTASIFSPLVMVFLLKRTSPRVCCLLGSVFLVVGVAGNAWFSRLELLCLTQGLCFGISIGLLFGTPFVSLTQYFDKRRALATSLSTCGASVGGIVFPLIFRHLLDEYAFEGGLLMVAGIQMHIFVFAALLVPADHYKRRSRRSVDALIQMEEVELNESNISGSVASLELSDGRIQPNGGSEKPKLWSEMKDAEELKEIPKPLTHSNHSTQLTKIPDSKNRTDSTRACCKPCASCLRENKHLRSVTFWLLCGFYLCASIGSSMPQTFIPALAAERGLTKDEGAFMLSILNMLDIPAHLIPGAIVNFRLLRPTRISILPMFIVGTLGNLTPLFFTYSSILSMSVVYGLFIGTYLVMQSLITIELLGAENFPKVMGIYFGITSLGPAMSYPICGVLKDISQSYTWTFHYLGSAAILATVILIVSPMARKYDLRRGVLREEGSEQ